MSANTRTRAHAQRHTHTGRHARTVQADRTRNAPANEIRFLGGFAVGTGLQSTAASGRGRLGWGRWREERRPEPSYQAAAAPLPSKPRAWESDSHLLGLSLGDPDVTVIRRGKEKKKENPPKKINS